MEQKPLTLPEHLSSPSVFSGVRVTRSLLLYVCFVDRCLSFCTFCWAIVLSVLLRYTDSDYFFDIFKLFLCIILVHNYFHCLVQDYFCLENNAKIRIQTNTRLQQSSLILPYIITLTNLLVFRKMKQMFHSYTFICQQRS